MAEALAFPEVTVASDAPEFDGYRVNRLGMAGGVPQRIKVVDVVALHGLACRPLLALLPLPDAPGRVRLRIWSRAPHEEPSRGPRRLRQCDLGSCIGLADAESL